MDIPLTFSQSSGRDSPASDDSSNPPLTPDSLTSPNTQPFHSPIDQSGDGGSNTTQASYTTTDATQAKRKPSRRANTAERRATHNAVERQRRETLNSRFLDLAALLPNLAQIRRPSKSAIVNSSISHVHASRRHRLLASRELRFIKLESDALRRELNEWRDRARLPRVEEPIRGEGFVMVLSGEVEALTVVVGDDDDEIGDGFGGYEDGDDEFPRTANSNSPVDDDDMRNSYPQASAAMMMKNANTFAHNPQGSNHNRSGSTDTSHLMPSAGQHNGPVIASTPPSVSYDNPAMTSLYEPQSGSPQYPGAHEFLHQPIGNQSDMNKDGAWSNPHLYQLQQLQAQRSLMTPPGSAHGLGPAPPNASGGMPNGFTDTTNNYYANFQRPQQLSL